MMWGNALGALIGFAVAACWFGGIWFASVGFPRDKRKSVRLVTVPVFAVLTAFGWFMLGPSRFGGESMTLSDQGVFFGLLVGACSLMFCLILAGRVELPETRTALTVSGLIQLVFFPIAGWFVAPAVFGD